MKVASLLFCVLSFFIPCVLFGASVFRPPAQTVPLQSYRIDIDASYFEPASRLDLDGEGQAYLDNEDYRLIEGNLKVRYGWSRQLEIWGGARMRMVESMDQQGESLTNSGVESVVAGLKYGLPSWIDNWRMAAELSYRQTTYENEEFPAGQASGDNIILGDDGSSFKAGLHLARNRFLGQSQFRGYLAYHRPPNDLSQEVLYDFSLNWLHGNWHLGGGVSGIYSMGLDDFENEPNIKPAMNTGNTNLFNSINREKVEPYINIGLQSGENSHLHFRAAQVVQGRSTDEGLSFLLGFSWGSSGVSDTQLKVETFKEYLIEASVTKVSPRGAFVQIDHGMGQDVDKGMRFDIYQTDYFGGNVMVATGVVYEVSSSSAIVRLTERYQDIKIQPGFRARGR